MFDCAYFYAVLYQYSAAGGITYIFCGVAEGAGENGVLNFPVQENTEIRDLLNAETLSAEKNFTLSLKPGQAKIIRVK